MCETQKVSLKAGRCSFLLLFFLIDWKRVVMTGAHTAILVHEVSAVF